MAQESMKKTLDLLLVRLQSAPAPGPTSPESSSSSQLPGDSPGVEFSPSQESFSPAVSAPAEPDPVATSSQHSLLLPDSATPLSTGPTGHEKEDEFSDIMESVQHSLVVPDFALPDVLQEYRDYLCTPSWWNSGGEVRRFVPRLPYQGQYKFVTNGSKDMFEELFNLKPCLWSYAFLGLCSHFLILRYIRSYLPKLNPPIDVFPGLKVSIARLLSRRGKEVRDGENGNKPLWLLIYKVFMVQRLLRAKGINCPCLAHDLDDLVIIPDDVEVEGIIKTQKSSLAEDDDGNNGHRLWSKIEHCTECSSYSHALDASLKLAIINDKLASVVQSHAQECPPRLAHALHSLRKKGVNEETFHLMRKEISTFDLEIEETHSSHQGRITSTKRNKASSANATGKRVRIEQPESAEGAQQAKKRGRPKKKQCTNHTVISLQQLDEDSSQSSQL